MYSRSQATSASIRHANPAKLMNRFTAISPLTTLMHLLPLFNHLTQLRCLVLIRGNKGIYLPSGVRDTRVWQASYHEGLPVKVSEADNELAGSPFAARTGA